METVILENTEMDCWGIKSSSDAMDTQWRGNSMAGSLRRRQHPQMEEGLTAFLIL